jgi:2-keto-3-deoxy-6-phosphogluconate aldolase
MRTFIQYDREGQIIAVVQTESLPEGLAQPFYLKDEGHSAAEITEDSAAVGHDAIELCQRFKFDAAQRKLVKKPDDPKAAA